VKLKMVLVFISECGQGMWQEWRRGEVHTEFGCRRNLRKRENSEDLGVLMRIYWMGSLRNMMEGFD
jgi:hypothetical protein